MYNPALNRKIFFSFHYMDTVCNILQAETDKTDYIIIEKYY